MTLFEQIHGEVEVVVDHLVAKSLAEVSRNLREDVESAFRTADFQTRNLDQKRDGKIEAALESLSHHCHAVLWASESGFGSLLCYRRAA